MWALIVNGQVADLTTLDPAGRFHPSMIWVPATASVQTGHLFANGTFSKPPPPPSKPRFVRLSTIRDRAGLAGKWAALAAAIDALPAADKWHLLTLEMGVSPDDTAVIALIKGADLDPVAVLAP
ncbi:MAG: hypothetical protein NVSMB20_03220 [Bradyrhizobium sp.]